MFYGFDDTRNRLVEMKFIHMAIFVLESHVYGEMMLYHLVLVAEFIWELSASIFKVQVVAEN